MRDLIVHIAHARHWAAAKRTGLYDPPMLHRDGFIHLSRPEQVHFPANAIYSETPDLVLLWIDPARVTGEIRDEPAGTGTQQTFPHLYGPLEVNAVIGESALDPWERDGFELPPPPSP
jgi:uncharacterized protein (DUF952 family)